MSEAIKGNGGVTMKRCKDCIWFISKPNNCWRDSCWIWGQDERPNCTMNNYYKYERKWWKFWRQK